MAHLYNLYEIIDYDKEKKSGKRSILWSILFVRFGENLVL
jgi:hypothetical protein